ncbi:MAG TPA: 50S ribosomal protein L24 [Candidatus Paceibacterota bacterium]|nr:50S ribosomal protein L24 [Candidatus Paceibacterota bacterium]
MNIKKGDTVVMLAGKDKGKKAKVLNISKATGRVHVEGVNMVGKRRKPKKSNEKGQTVQIAMPVDGSNVALWCNSCGKGRRVGSKMEGDKKVRVCVKCKGTI